MHRSSYILLWLILLSPTTGDASKVLKLGTQGKVIAVSQNRETRWALNDHLCVMHGETEVACGQVIKASSKGALLKIRYQREPIEEGDRVQPAARMPLSQSRLTLSDTDDKISEKPLPVVKMSRRLSSTGEGFPNAELAHHFDFTVGTNYIFPVANFQIALSQHYALALIPTYYQYSTLGIESNGPGGMGTINYYGYAPFDGFWFQAGFGLFDHKVGYRSQEGHITSETVLVSLGWRWLRRNFNVGAALGAQYFHLKQSDFLPGELSLVLPTFLIDVGIAF